jgi:hypothetical protein
MYKYTPVSYEEIKDANVEDDMCNFCERIFENPEEMYWVDENVDEGSWFLYACFCNELCFNCWVLKWG